MQHVEVSKIGVESELQLLAYTTTHNNARSPSHRVEPGIEPASSWILVGFLTAVPQWELPKLSLLLKSFACLRVPWKWRFVSIGLLPKNAERA